jgi:histidine ammonia-lyase
MINIGQEYTPLELYRLVVLEKQKAKLTKDAMERIVKCNTFLHDKIKRSEKPIYGVNTGFGSLCDTLIPEKDLAQLQVNLLRSHACGFGNMVPDDIVRLMLILKAQSLAFGYSGVQLETVDLIISLYNTDVLPVVYEQGSLGASGDLAPLAHLSLPLIGEGKVRYQGKIKKAADVFQKLSFTPISLGAKEGLALINGTQFMQGYGVYILAQMNKLIHQANVIGAMSLEAFNCNTSPFLPGSHQIRKQLGQIVCAKEIAELIEGSEIANSENKAVQDPYSFRCMPQVHGASLDAFGHIYKIFEREINAVTDNPNIFPDEDLVVSAGNFHGQTLALQLDFAAIALSEIANISERRIYKLISGERNLPPYLIKNPGINSGFMIAQYTAASIVSQNKQLATPSSVDSIVSSNGQEDHVSMGANAATKSLRLINNVDSVLQIEMKTVFQAMHFRRPLKSSTKIEKIINLIGQQIEVIDNDVILGDWLKKVNKDEILQDL